MIDHSKESSAGEGRVKARASSRPTPKTKQMMTVEQLDAIEALLKKATPGPYIVRHDEARECGPHANSGLARIETTLGLDPRSVKGKFPYWPVLRLGEWPTTEYIAALLNSAPSLLASARKVERMEALLRRVKKSLLFNRVAPKLRDDISKELDQ